MATSANHGMAKRGESADTESPPKSSSMNPDRHDFGSLDTERTSGTTSQRWDGSDDDTAATVEGPPRCQNCPSNELADFDEFGIQVEEFARLDAFHNEYDALEAHIAGLKRQLEECEQEVGEVMKKKNELHDRLVDRHSQTVARLQADVDEDQRKVDSKKRKLDWMVERHAQFQSARRVRESLGDET